MTVIFQFTKREFENELMSAWVEGWYANQDKLQNNDDGKRIYSRARILKLLET